MKLPIQVQPIVRNKNIYQVSGKRGLRSFLYPAQAGTCSSVADPRRQSCTLLSSHCQQGQLPNPGVYPGCQCSCQPMGQGNA